MIKWIKKNGTEVVTNDLQANIEAAVSLGWTRKEEPKKEEPKKEEPKKEEPKKEEPKKEIK